VIRGDFNATAPLASGRSEPLPDFVLNGYFDTDLLGKFIDARAYQLVAERFGLV